MNHSPHRRSVLYAVVLILAVVPEFGLPVGRAEAQVAPETPKGVWRVFASSYFDGEKDVNLEIDGKYNQFIIISNDYFVRLAVDSSSGEVAGCMAARIFESRPERMKIRVFAAMRPDEHGMIGTVAEIEMRLHGGAVNLCILPIAGFAARSSETLIRVSSATSDPVDQWSLLGSQNDQAGPYLPPKKSLNFLSLIFDDRAVHIVHHDQGQIRDVMCSRKRALGPGVDIENLEFSIPGRDVRSAPSRIVTRLKATKDYLMTERIFLEDATNKLTEVYRAHRPGR